MHPLNHCELIDGICNQVPFIIIYPYAILRNDNEDALRRAFNSRTRLHDKYIHHADVT
jgi:hypothetical protein